MLRIMLALALVLSSCAAPGPTPADIAADRSTRPLDHMDQRAGLSLTSAYDGFYVGTWTPGPCAGAVSVTRTLQVETLLASSGVNYPLRGTVQPDGTASLAYGKAALIGQIGADGVFRGKANTGKACTWDVSMSRQPPIASAASTDTALPAAVVNQDEVPQSPGAAARSVGPPPAASSRD